MREELLKVTAQWMHVQRQVRQHARHVHGNGFHTALRRLQASGTTRSGNGADAESHYTFTSTAKSATSRQGRALGSRLQKLARQEMDARDPVKKALKSIAEPGSGEGASGTGQGNHD